jgi:hypothetical protein
MRPLQYHEGQIAIQDEANTRRLADNLAHWNGPVAEFAMGADLLLFATENDFEQLEFSVLSGRPPLVEVAGPSALALADGIARRLQAGRCGGLAINLATARRVRINGYVEVSGDDRILHLDEAFTLCRKYMAPSGIMGDVPCTGPGRREALNTDAAVVADALAGSECVFLATVAPDGAPDVAHRGGPAGFVTLDAAAGTIAWPEYLGDGVFKSAGNIRATGSATLLVPDFQSGDGFELVLSGVRYTNVRTSRRERIDPLVQEGQPFPVQGLMEATVERVFRLEGLTYPRQRLQERVRVTSRSEVHVQAPQ